MPQDQLEERLRKVENEITKISGTVGSINDKLIMILNYEERIRSLENFRSKTLGYCAGLVGLGGVLLFLIDKFIK